MPGGIVAVGATCSPTEESVEVVVAVTVTYATGVLLDVAGCARPAVFGCAIASTGTGLGLLTLCVAETEPLPATLIVPTARPVTAGMVICELPLLGSAVAPTPGTAGNDATGLPPLHAATTISV